jgi:hypothetical protein
VEETTFSPALLDPPSAARLKTATWSPGAVEIDLALTATPLATSTATGGVLVKTEKTGGSGTPLAARLTAGVRKPSERPLASASSRRLAGDTCMWDLHRRLSMQADWQVVSEQALITGRRA